MGMNVPAAACLGALLLACVPARAQSPFDPNAPPAGKQAGGVMVRLRGIGVLPQNWDSSVSAIGGRVDASNEATPELDISYFFTDHIAAELIAATTRHQVTAIKTALGRVPVGEIRVLPPTVTLQYHFMPKSRFSPYIGAGLNVTFFFNDTPARPTVSSVGFDHNVGGAIQAGFDYNISGRWFLNVDVKQIFVKTTARINGGAIVAKTWLNPTVVGAGIGFRF